MTNPIIIPILTKAERIWLCNLLAFVRKNNGSGELSIGRFDEDGSVEKEIIVYQINKKFSKREDYYSNPRPFVREGFDIDDDLAIAHAIQLDFIDKINKKDFPCFEMDWVIIHFDETDKEKYTFKEYHGSNKETTSIKELNVTKYYKIPSSIITEIATDFSGKELVE